MLGNPLTTSNQVSDSAGSQLALENRLHDHWRAASWFGTNPSRDCGQVQALMSRDLWGNFGYVATRPEARIAPTVQPLSRLRSPHTLRGLDGNVV
jgi:hypothetical protein